MLDIIRSNAQSFWVKVAFGVIILVFVFWGIGSFTDTGNVNIVGTVNGEPITYQQFEMSYRRAEEAINQQSPRRTWTAEEKSQLGRQVFQQLVVERLIVQEARRNNIDISPYELRLYVGQLKEFQDAQGKFDPERYKNVLAATRQTPASFEEDLTRRLLIEKTVAFVSQGSWTDSLEARARFNFLRQKRVMEYIYVPATPKESQEIAADQIAKFYDDHKMDYAIPQKADVQYIEVNPLTLVSAEAITDEQARAWYEKNQGRFVEPETIEVSHILVPVEQNAPAEDVKKAEEKVAAIQNELASGKAFADVADAYNPKNAADKGGRVGWISHGMTVPAFDKAAFAAKEGVVTAPVRSEFGFHLILVTGRKAEAVKKFEDVRAEIQKTLAGEASRDKLGDVLDALVEDNILGKDLAASASANGLTLKSSGLMSRDEIQKTLGINAEGASSIMSKGANQPVDMPLTAGDKYVVVRVTKTSPASFKPLEEVKADVVTRIRSADALAAAMKELETVLKGADKGLEESWKSKVVVSAAVDRGSALAPFASHPELDDAMFTTAPGSWLPGVYAVQKDKEQGALIARVAKIEDPSAQEWQQFEPIMMNLTQRERQDGVYQAFMEDLASKSKIEVRNQDIIDRKNM